LVYTARLKPVDHVTRSVALPAVGMATVLDALLVREGQMTADRTSKKQRTFLVHGKYELRESRGVVVRRGRVARKKRAYRQMNYGVEVKMMQW
jgi:hypothetical protein